MQKIKNTRLRASCQEALVDDNLERCLQELSSWFSGDDEIINQRGRLSSLRKKERNNIISLEESILENNKIRMALTAFVNENILLEDDDEIIEGIHNRLLLLCSEERKSDWEAMFSEQNFSHALVLSYDTAIPSAYLSPDVVIFDDTVTAARNYMVKYAVEMPKAHFLYFGELNPFSDTRKRVERDAAIFERCANANSKFTVHARLRELLEFRKVYGPPGQ